MKWIVGVLALIVIAILMIFAFVPSYFDNKTNVVLDHSPYVISEEAAALHESLFVADLHADTLLWARNPAKRQSRGHTDLPRLREGGVALQVFGAVTKTPKSMNYETNDANSDKLTMLVVLQRWPLKTWNNIFERAMFQVERLERLERRAGDEFKFVRTSRDLSSAIRDRKLAGVMGMEGAHPLEGEIENLDRLFDAGYRVIGLQHFFDNALGGSLHGQSRAGLTEFGEQAVDLADELRMIIDVAHSSEATVRDVLARSDRPVIVSHTGFNGHCDSARNISDELMEEIAAAGGLIGVGYWDGAVCEPTPDAIAQAILYGVQLIGVDHVALGGDFDGAVQTPFDTSELSAITDALLRAGADERTIRAVMGENTIRFFQENLPA